MTELMIHRAPENSNAIALPLPEARVPIEVRPAAPGTSDLAFVDQLQKMHTKMVGWMPTKQLENYIQHGQVLIAEEHEPRRHGGTETAEINGGKSPVQMPSSVSPCLRGSKPVGYCISHDKYLKREELGIVYQLNVLPIKQRGLIGATLIKHVFDRAAYGCKLFCCWCAQDLEANYFWESIGFVPLAFRTGSRPRIKKDGTVSKRERTHIFWQRRIREGDTQTPYWFPSETTGGSLRENRLVLPIPPGTHWSDAKPAIFPEVPGMENVNVLPAGSEESRPRARKVKPPKPERPKGVAPGGLWFAPQPTPEEIAKAKEEEKKAKRPRPRMKNDPKLVAAARELRDRYTEQINAGLLLPPSACGKYDVSRQLEAAPTNFRGRGAMKVEQVPGVNLLEAA